MFRPFDSENSLSAFKYVAPVCQMRMILALAFFIASLFVASAAQPVTANEAPTTMPKIINPKCLEAGMAKSVE